ncbi:hypothetical protein BSK49_16510 [Paenibacillus odorifer]|uniref:hypothetical protein n=1 Tax=Paenibacillus TaxID=44249 RepID=UPI00096C6190|nr:hypothetical protein [Paenibacillus odorifer]OMD88247.1 hypothetical protein BSK49_16510 [Paenibacillus odorifer]
MKKKILAGLLTVSACFALGSTSFAATAPTTAPDPIPVSSVASGPTFEQITIYMDSGEQRCIPGVLRELIYNDGAIILHENGWVSAVQYGTANIFAYDALGNIKSFTILVDRDK